MSLPQISQQTRETLRRQGHFNRLYEGMKLSDFHQPRTLAYNIMTYGIMALSGLGYLVAGRYGYTNRVFGMSFFAAPVFALLQKRQLDYYESSSNNIIHSQQLAEQFPVLYQQYNKVLGEVEEEISKQKQILRNLEAQQ